MSTRSHSSAIGRAAAALRCCLAAAALLACSDARGADPTVSLSFQGTYVAQTCRISGSNDQLIDMPEVSASTLARAGDTAGSTPFSIEVQCEGGVSAVALTFESPWAQDGRLGLGTGAAIAKQVQIQLLKGDGTPIVVGDPGSAAAFAVGSAAPVSLPFVAQYYANGQSEAGRVLTMARFIVHVR